MTSPAQLKYLDAIGIPVWVSRERIVLVDKETLDVVELPSEESDCVGSAEDILHSLEQKTAQPIRKDFKLEESVAKKETMVQPEANPHQQQAAGSNELSSEKRLANEIGRTEQHIIYACGDLNADWLIIGESPETSEERQHQPFANNSSVLLSNMLRSVGLANPREDAYLINVLKLSFSADDVKDSSKQLNQLLHEKIVAINPKVILIVGQMSAQNLLQSKEPLVRLRSKSHTFGDTNIPVVVTYYPSYLLSKPLDKRKTWADLKLAMTLIKNE